MTRRHSARPEDCRRADRPPDATARRAQRGLRVARREPSSRCFTAMPIASTVWSAEEPGSFLYSAKNAFWAVDAEPLRGLRPTRPPPSASAAFGSVPAQTEEHIRSMRQRIVLPARHDHVEQADVGRVA